MAEEDVEKAAFVGRDGLWEWLVIPFGVMRAPARYIPMMSELLANHIKAGYCIVFLDDILILSDSQGDHGWHVHGSFPHELEKVRVWHTRDRVCGVRRLGLWGSDISREDPGDHWMTDGKLTKRRSNFLGLVGV